MKPLRLQEINQAVSGELISNRSNKIIKNISTDTRTMNQGDMFIALIGDNFDGHKFVTEAV